MTAHLSLTAGVAHDLADGGLANAQHARALAQAQPGFKMQAKGLT